MSSVVQRADTEGGYLIVEYFSFNDAEATAVQMHKNMKAAAAVRQRSLRPGNTYSSVVDRHPTLMLGFETFDRHVDGCIINGLRFAMREFVSPLMNVFQQVCDRWKLSAPMKAGTNGDLLPRISRI